MFLFFANVMADLGFTTDFNRLEELVLRIHDAAIKREGIFQGGFKRYLPQFNLPQELEHEPEVRETKDSKTASLYLFTEAFFERRTKSAQIIRNAKIAWVHDRWFFDPEQVIEHGVSDVERVMQDVFNYAYSGPNEAPPWEHYMFNAEHLVEKRQGDPRKAVTGFTASQARDNIREFRGFGNGIANLYLMYLIDRNIAQPVDPENALLKIDVWKSMLPINVGAVIPNDEEISRNEVLGRELEAAYHAICKKHNLDSAFVDSAVWIAGSEGCRTKDYLFCQDHCPALAMCQSRVYEDAGTGRFQVVKNGERIEVRKNMGQTSLFPTDAFSFD